MNKVKERMKQLKDDIEEAQQRETDAKNAMREVEQNLARLEGEKTTLLSRINVLRAEFKKTNDRLNESNEKLDRALARSEQSEVRRKQLAENEIDDFERSEELETTVKNAITARENAEHLVAEGERKITILEGDLARASEKYERFTERNEDLSEEISDTSERIRNLQEKDRDASEREDINEEKAKFLESQLQQSLSTAEGLERQAVKLERLRDQLEGENDSYKDKCEKVRLDLEEAMGEILDDD